MQTTLEQIKLYTTLWRETTILYEDWAKRHGLSYYELLVLLSLSESEGVCKQKDICREWVLPKQTVNTILKHFLERSWVTLVPSGEDRRNKDILLTESGHRFVCLTVDELQAHESTVWKAFGEWKANTLIELTALYNKLFKEVINDEPS